MPKSIKRKPTVNVAASVRARLLNLSKQRRQPLDLLLTRYALERLLYRLSTSKYRDRFILKGAMLITCWTEDPHRPTRDLDLLGDGDPSPEAMLATFREICGAKIDDGVVFDVDGLAVEAIREQNEYGGMRLKTKAEIAGAKPRIIIDIAFGDAVEPAPIDIEMPVLLDQPSPNLRAYSHETVIAEKFQAMVDLGRANGRMKDFYDIWALARSHKFKKDPLARAIAATFARRKTEIPASAPDALTAAFAEDPIKRQQWSAFVGDVAVDPGSLADVVKTLEAFLMPHAAEARRGGESRGSVASGDTRRT
jgi:predicted nucleotidyltransferase component of viral defense system